MCFSTRKRPENEKTTSIDVAQRLCTGGHGPPKLSPEHKTVCYSPRKQPQHAKTTIFAVAPETVYRGSRSPKIVPGTQNYVLWHTKTAGKCENDEEGNHPRDRVTGVTGPKNRPQNPKQCAMAHENSHKTRKRLFSTPPQRPCTGGHGTRKSSPEHKTV